MQLESGSIRALACSDRRPRPSEEGTIKPLTGDSYGCLIVVGEGADHSTRGRVRSPFDLNRSSLVPRSRTRVRVRFTFFHDCRQFFLAL